MKFAITALLLIVISLSSASTISAQAIPSFPSCPNPGGEIIAKYDSGKHGVPGDSTEYMGADTVFKLNDAMVVQCLCPDSGSGVQTLWWKDPGLSADQQSIVVRQGWIRIPNGSLWGLDNSVYFTKNSNFECKGRGGAVLGASTSNSGATINDPGSILGASTLAGTGNWMTIAGIFTLAVATGLVARTFRRAA